MARRRLRHSYALRALYDRQFQVELELILLYYWNTGEFAPQTGPGRARPGSFSFRASFKFMGAFSYNVRYALTLRDIVATLVLQGPW